MTKTPLPLNPGLYVTATPIGNLGDITLRALEALKGADLILCEDTRHTARLCGAYEIKTPRAPYHDHNGARVRPDILRQLQEGARICLVSDAGTPLISDPGYKLVSEAREAGIPVYPLPGACAAIAALSASGLPSDSFYFAGFLPQKQGAKGARLKMLAQIDATLIIYETAPRLATTLTAMVTAFGDRQAIVARELTKTFEEFKEDTLSSLAGFYADNRPKGEIVILVEPPANQQPSDQEIDAYLQSALTRLRVRDAAAETAEQFGITKKDAYARALLIQEEN